MVLVFQLLQPAAGRKEQEALKISNAAHLKFNASMAVVRTVTPHVCLFLNKR